MQLAETGIWKLKNRYSKIGRMGFRVLRRSAAPPLFPKVLFRLLIELRLAALGAEI